MNGTIDVPCALGGQLWLVDLRSAVSETDLNLLAPWERDRATRFRFEKDARRYLVSHVALRRLVSRHLNMGPAQVALQTTPLGKPFIDGHPVHFNLSHSEDWALIGLQERQVIGVDIEVRHNIPDLEAVARQNYTCAELAELRQSSDPLGAFFTCWTRKEACLKALGSGFSIEASCFEAGVDAQDQTVQIATPDKRLCTMTVCSLDFSREPDKHPHLPQLYGAIAVVAPEDAARVC